MCGRYFLNIGWGEFRRTLSYDIPISEDFYECFKMGEVFPTNIVPIITSEQGLTLAKWGFPMGNKKSIVINARLENLRDRMMFRDIVDRQRCIVPASAYFEWKKTSDGGEEEGRYIIEKDDSILYMAGLYNSFSDKYTQLSLWDKKVDLDYLAFTIITKEANEYLSNIHHRMPLILNKKEAEGWLKGEDIANVKSDDEKSILYSRYQKR